MTSCRVNHTFIGVGRTSSKGRRNRVRQLRLIAGLTQAELADVTGVTRQTIVAVEAGDYAPSVYLALAVGERLGATVEELFGAEPAVGRTSGTREEGGGR